MPIKLFQVEMFVIDKIFQICTPIVPILIFFLNLALPHLTSPSIPTFLPLNQD